MIYVKETEIRNMEQTILDELTGMTLLDYFESKGICDNWVIVKDNENNG